MDSGVARHKIYDLKEYASQLEDRLGSNGAFMKGLRDKLAALVKKRGTKVKTVFAEGSNTRVLQAVKSLLEDDKIEPILLGNPKTIHSKMEALGLDDLKSVEIIKPKTHPKFKEFYTEYCKQKQRNGSSIYHAEDLMSQENYFGSMMVRKGMADSFIAGPTLS